MTGPAPRGREEMRVHEIPLDEVRVRDPRTPIMLIVDDPAPVVHVYRCHVVDVHHAEPQTEDGRPLVEEVPNEFMRRFVEVVRRRGIRGKFSIVPGLGGRGDLVHGIDGGRVGEIAEWLDLARRGLATRMDFCPEGITHNLAVDLEHGGFLPVSEYEWAATQTETTLTAYLTRALEMLREAGVEATGVTSPWSFGIQVEAAYRRAIVAAMKGVYQRDRTWYFLHDRHERPETRPEVVIDEPPTKLVSIACTIKDHCWQTINSPDTSEGYVRGIADQFLTADGRSGDILSVLRAGGWPILVTHWQSVFSNGLETGIRVMDEVARRVEEHLGDELVWCSASEVMERTILASGSEASQG